MRLETVICPVCTHEWQISTIALSRSRGPLWCERCRRKADEELQAVVKRDVANRDSDSEDTRRGPIAQARMTGSAPAR